VNRETAERVQRRMSFFVFVVSWFRGFVVSWFRGFRGFRVKLVGFVKVARKISHV
jgi:hypothetical protein